MKKLTWAFIGLAVVFGLLQCTNPARTNPPVVNDLVVAASPPAPVARLLRTACYDCHSHKTKWPWYSHVAPASWLVVHDVNEGRAHVNFSDWPVARPEGAAKRLDNMSEEISYRDMPPKQYTLIHVDTRLTDSQREELTNWLDAEAGRLRATAR